jgi:aspartyl protease family protein
MNAKALLRGLVVGALLVAMAGGLLAYFFDIGPIDETFTADDEGPRIVALSAIAFVMLASLVFGPPRPARGSHGCRHLGHARPGPGCRIHLPL